MKQSLQLAEPVTISVGSSSFRVLALNYADVPTIVHESRKLRGDMTRGDIKSATSCAERLVDLIAAAFVFSGPVPNAIQRWRLKRLLRRLALPDCVQTLGQISAPVTKEFRRSQQPRAAQPWRGAIH